MEKKRTFIVFLVFAITVSAAAFDETALKSVTAFINRNLKLTFNGEAFNPNANGQILEPLSYKEQVYLPLNALAEKAGLTVDLNKDANELCIKTKDYVESHIDWQGPPVVRKPNIYLYPPQKQEITVKLNFKGDLTVAYPSYNSQIGGWRVTAYPDGKIINKEDNREYSYLFWEGKNANLKYDLAAGFVVAGQDTQRFLQEKLAAMGLTPKEYNEFIVYWLPKMWANKYNLIHFAGKEYTDIAQLEIIPEPDAILRVFMLFKPSDKQIEVEPQTITPFKRKGFTVVEWGGSELP